jgi:cytochrome c6
MAISLKPWSEARPLALGLLRGLLLLAALLLLIWPRPAWAVADAVDLGRGAQLFENHCAGCHVNGGNIIRRGKTLQLKVLERQGLASQEAIATIAAAGRGQMSGYGSVLGDDGVGDVAAWVWQQALAGWDRG